MIRFINKIVNVSMGYFSYGKAVNTIDIVSREYARLFFLLDMFCYSFSFLHWKKKKGREESFLILLLSILLLFSFPINSKRCLDKKRRRYIRLPTYLFSPNNNERKNNNEENFESNNQSNTLILLPTNKDLRISISRVSTTNVLTLKSWKKVTWWREINRAVSLFSLLSANIRSTGCIN